MKRFARVALLAATLCGLAFSASATELKVKGSLDVYGQWSSNLMDLNNDKSDPDNYATSQRLRTYFTFEANKNLKAILGLEINDLWGDSANGAGFGTDGTNTMRVKHAYLDFTIPDTVVNVKAGLQVVALPSVFGNPVFDDDAAALVISAPINDMFGITVGYSRGGDSITNYDTTESVTNDNIDMFFVAAPITLNGFAVTPYAAYASIGDAISAPAQALSVRSAVQTKLAADGADIWVLGANAKLTMFDPLTFAADIIYGEANSDNYDTKGWYGALAGSYKFDFMTATLFGTYATGADKDTDKDNYLPTLAETWYITPNIGGYRAFTTNYSNTIRGFASSRNVLNEGYDGTGIWTAGVKLDKISFMDKLSHSLTLLYAHGTSDEINNGIGSSASKFDKKDSACEAYLVNTYQIFENLALINELDYFAPHTNWKSSSSAAKSFPDSSYFATIGLQYKF